MIDEKQAVIGLELHDRKGVLGKADTDFLVLSDIVPKPAKDKETDKCKYLIFQTDLI